MNCITIRHQNSQSVHRSTLRIGCVSFLNARPLIHGLDLRDDVSLFLDVPACLLDGLREDRFDVALLPVIDYQRMEGLELIPAGGIGSDGATLTVRIFSRVPIHEINMLACDTDSHTSVALARMIMARVYVRYPGFVDYRSGNGLSSVGDAILLIGDKVICDPPSGFSYALDLGAAWKEMTGLPFVFAVWTGKAGNVTRNVFETLNDARKLGLEQIDSIIQRFAIPIGWSPEVARRYLTKHLRYVITPRELQAIELFHQLSAEEGIISKPIKPIRVFHADG